MLTHESIQSTIKCQNLVIRNLQVTQGYYRISEGMRRVIGNKNVSWCAFATHASKTAGQAIRHENMPSKLKSAMFRMAGYDNTFVYLNDALAQDQVLPDEEANPLASAFKEVSLLISAGNILVYKELATPFVNLVTTFYKDYDRDEAKLQAFLAKNLRPGRLSADGQDYLIEAFTAFYNSRFETDPKRKAELVLKGNLLIGLHEQTRLQPYIEKALTVPVDIFIEGRSSGRTPGFRERLRKQTAGLSREFIKRTVTQQMMGITLPSRELKLGQNIIAPTGVHSYPKDLFDIQDPRCAALVSHFERGQDTLSGSAAGDWASLTDRMSFVVDFFRSHQQYKRLFESPFLESQALAIEAGHLPAGSL